MRGEDHIRDPAQRRVERLFVRVRLGGIDIDGGACEVAGLEARGERLEVDDVAAREVEEVRARLHLAQLALADEMRVLAAAVDMEADDIGLREEFAEVLRAPRVAERHDLGDVVVEDLHAHRLGEHRELRADVAVADDAERLAADLAAALRALAPAARVEDAVALERAAHEHDDLADRELDHAARVRVRRVEDGDATRGGGGEVDLLGADAEAADREEAVRGGEGGGRHAGLRADAEERDALERAGEFGLGQRVGDRLDLVAFVREHVRGVGVDVLEEERDHARLREARGAGEAVDPEELVDAADDAVGARDDILALDVLAVGDELLRGAFVADLAVGRAVADGDDGARELQRAHGGGLALRLREGGVGVVADDGLAVLRPAEVVGDDMVGGDAELGADGHDIVAEARADDIDARGVAADGGLVAAEARREALLQELDGRVDMRAGDRELREAPAEGFVDPDAAFHAVACDAFDREDLGVAVGVVGEREASDLVEALGGDDGRVEVEDEGGLCGRHGAEHIGTRTGRGKENGRVGVGPPSGAPPLVHGTCRSVPGTAWHVPCTL